MISQNNYHRMIRYFYFLATVFAFSTAGAQSISGSVSDAAGAPNAFAAIRLFQIGESDSTQVAGANADADGRFVFNTTTPGNYRVKAALVGFEDAVSSVFYFSGKENKTLLSIQMNTLATLKEVVVSASKPLIDVQVDKTVVNVEGTILSAGGTALDILQRSPGVVVTPQEQINLAGKGAANVLIDGKSTGLNDAELAAYLRSLSSETIRSIELITNPSARYDAQGTAGIINIRLKKNQNFGAKGNVALGYSQSIHHRLNGGLNLNYRPGPVNFFLNTNFYDAGQTVSQKIDRYQNGKHFDQDNPTIADWNSQLAKTGMDWYINDFQTLGVMVTGSRYDHKTRGFSTNRISDMVSGAVDSVIASQSVHPEFNRRVNYNINYRFADTTGHELTIDADRIDYASSANNRIDNLISRTESTTARNFAYGAIQGQGIGIWSVKTDYTATKKNGWKWETGAKITMTDSDNQTEGYTDAGNGFVPDAGRTNAFELQENIGAVFANLGKNIKKWTFLAGLRAEHTQINGASTNLSGERINSPDTSYNNLFPNVFVQYQMSENHQFGLSVNRRLERPLYQDLNPFIWQTDPYTSERGNSGLTPAFSQSAALKYTYKWAASVELNYTKTTNIIQTVARTSGDMVWLQPFNIATSDNTGIQINSPLPIAKWWSGYASLGVWYNRFRLAVDCQQLQTATWGGSFWTGQQIKLGNDWQYEFSVWAQLPTTEGMFRNKGIASLDMGLKKTFLKGKATVKLAVYDVLGTQHWVETVDFNGLQARRRNDWESQSVALRLNWNFGNEKVKIRERKQQETDAVNRIKKGSNQ